MPDLKYRKIYHFLRAQIQQGVYPVGVYLPSENELCTGFNITRTTARKALDELLKENFIEKQHGKGSKVKERSQSLGLLNVKGFSEAVGKNAHTIFLQKPKLSEWSNEIILPIKKSDKNSPCIFFERIRCINSEPVMLEKSWFPANVIPGFSHKSLVEESFFKTLSKEYLIEITGSTQEIRAEFADKKTEKILRINSKSPILHISIQFSTSNNKLNIYSELYCNTKEFPIGNTYSM